MKTAAVYARVSTRNSKAHIVMVIGTAGSGKSTMLMRLALECQAAGRDVFWLDPDTELSVWQIRDKVFDE